MSATTQQPILVLTGTGKSGRRVVRRLEDRGIPVRVGSRSGSPAFDWERPGTWAPVLDGTAAVYLSYVPDIAMPGAGATAAAFARLAVRSGVRRIVLLSGRGEVEAERAEQAVRDAAGDVDVTVLRASWFMQNFSEDFMLDHVTSGEIRLPAGDERVPFVDVEDLADVAAAALTGDRHAGELYELTGPRALTFGDVAAEIAAATGRPLRYTPVSLDENAAELAGQGVPAEVVDLLTHLFDVVVVEANAGTADGVRRALGREPRDFAEYARRAAATGVWSSTRMAA